MYHRGSTMKKEKFNEIKVEFPIHRLGLGTANVSKEKATVQRRDSKHSTVDEVLIRVDFFAHFSDDNR